MVPRVFRSSDTVPFLPNAATRADSSAASSPAAATAPRISVSSWAMSDTGFPFEARGCGRLAWPRSSPGCYDDGQDLWDGDEPAERDPQSLARTWSGPVPAFGTSLPSGFDRGITLQDGEGVGCWLGCCGPLRCW